MCGRDPSVSTSPNLFYVNLGFGQCVTTCPNYDASPTSLDQKDYVCMSWLNEKIQGDAAKFQAYITSSASGCSDPNSGSYTYKYSATCACRLVYDSKAIFSRCVKKVSTDPVDPNNPTQSDYLRMYMSDLITARNVVFGFGFGVALVFSFLFTYLMSKDCIAWILVWACVAGVLAMGIAVVVYGQKKYAEWQAQNPPQHTKSQMDGLRGFNYTFMALSIVWFLLMLVFRKAINMAIKCLSMGSKAVEEMPIMVFMPLLQIGGFLLFLVPLVYYGLFIASDGTMVIKYGTVNYLGISTDVMVGRSWVVDQNNHVGGKLWFLFFVLLWTMNFIANLGSLVIANAVSRWYFTKPADRVEAINNSTLWDAYKLVFRYHLGTVAFGSFLIALCQYARWVALYIQKHTSKKFREKLWVKVVFCCINCCLCVLEHCMKFISKNAYIQTAIHGTPFCASAKASFSLIANNILRIGAILVTSDFALFIGKIFATVLPTGLSYMYLANNFKDDLYDPVAPSIMVAVISFMTATMFMDVLHMSIDTIFHCFISDENSNGGVAVFAHDTVTAFVDKHGKLDATHHDDNHCCGYHHADEEPEANIQLANSQ